MSSIRIKHHPRSEPASNRQGYQSRVGESLSRDVLVDFQPANVAGNCEAVYRLLGGAVGGAEQDAGLNSLKPTAPEAALPGLSKGFNKPRAWRCRRRTALCSRYQGRNEVVDMEDPPGRTRRDGARNSTVQRISSVPAARLSDNGNVNPR